MRSVRSSAFALIAAVGLRGPTRDAIVIGARARNPAIRARRSSLIRVLTAVERRHRRDIPGERWRFGSKKGSFANVEAPSQKCAGVPVSSTCP